MSAKLSTRNVDHVTVVDIEGKITLGEGSARMRDLLHELVSTGHKNILFNLSQVTYLDSAGVGELVMAYTTMTNRGGVLKLVGLTNRVKDLLQITKLYTVFDVHETEKHAILSFPRATAEAAGSPGSDVTSSAGSD